MKKGVISRYTADLLTDGKFSQVNSYTSILKALDSLNKTTKLITDDLITIAVDNDKEALKFIEKLKEDNIPFQIDLAPKSDGVKKMDWNEYLQKEKAGEKKMPEENSHKEFQAPSVSLEELYQSEFLADKLDSTEQENLQEERNLLLPLPDRRYRLKELESRIISPDCYISIGGNKYSVPDIFAAKPCISELFMGLGSSCSFMTERRTML